MSYYIRVEGHDGRIPVSLENLLEKGVTKHTWICKYDSEEWDIAENFRELDSIWERKDSAVTTEEVITNEEHIHNEESENIAETPEYETAIEQTKIVENEPPITKEKVIDRDNSTTIEEIKEVELSESPEEETTQNESDKKKQPKKNAAILTIVGLILLLIVLFFGRKWFWPEIFANVPDKPIVPIEPKRPDHTIKIGTPNLPDTPSGENGGKTEEPKQEIADNTPTSTDRRKQRKDDENHRNESSIKKPTPSPTVREADKPSQPIDVNKGNYQKELECLLNEVESGNLTIEGKKTKFIRIKQLLDEHAELNKEKVNEMAVAYEQEADSLCNSYKPLNKLNLIKNVNAVYFYVAQLKQKNFPRKCQ